LCAGPRIFGDLTKVPQVFRHPVLLLRLQVDAIQERTVERERFDLS
jgi:hypothetical protein